VSKRKVTLEERLKEPGFAEKVRVAGVKLDLLVAEYDSGYARGIEDALRAAKGSDWTRNGVCDAIRRLLPPTEVGK
jgi:hypothetical protein